jgi:hypothetical protein
MGYYAFQVAPTQKPFYIENKSLTFKIVNNGVKCLWKAR